jgi:hypothetical protein
LSCSYLSHKIGARTFAYRLMHWLDASYPSAFLKSRVFWQTQKQNQTINVRDTKKTEQTISFRHKPQTN